MFGAMRTRRTPSPELNGVGMPRSGDQSRIHSARPGTLGNACGRPNDARASGSGSCSRTRRKAPPNRRLDPGVPDLALLTLARPAAPNLSKRQRTRPTVPVTSKPGCCSTTPWRPTGGQIGEDRAALQFGHDQVPVRRSIFVAVEEMRRQVASGTARHRQSGRRRNSPFLRPVMRPNLPAPGQEPRGTWPRAAARRCGRTAIGRTVLDRCRCPSTSARDSQPMPRLIPTRRRTPRSPGSGPEVAVTRRVRSTRAPVTVLLDPRALGDRDHPRAAPAWRIARAATRRHRRARRMPLGHEDQLRPPTTTPA